MYKLLKFKKRFNIRLAVMLLILSIVSSIFFLPGCDKGGDLQNPSSTQSTVGTSGANSTESEDAEQSTMEDNKGEESKNNEEDNVTVPQKQEDEMFWDDFNSDKDYTLSEHTSSSGHTYSGSDVKDGAVEASSGRLHFPLDPDGNVAWWATPDVTPESSNYRAAISDATLGGTKEWFHLFVGVRHDGKLRGTETVYDLELRGSNPGLTLRRTNAGKVTVLASEPNFAINNNIGAATSVKMEIEAVTEGDVVILNAWVTISDGKRMNVFQNIEDSADSRITDTGRPAFGMSVIVPRIGKVELLAAVGADSSDAVSNEGEEASTLSKFEQAIKRFEEDMMYHAKAVGEAQKNQTHQDSFYYDGIRVHQQIRDYAIAKLDNEQAKEYLDNVEGYIERSIEVVRDGYVIPKNGVVEDWRRFSKGLYYHYMETKDQLSYDALIMLRDGRQVGTGDPVSHPEFAKSSWIREMSYWLQAHTWAEKLDGKRNEEKVSKYVEYLENHLYQIRYDSDRTQSFYMGLIGTALIEWYAFAGDTYWPEDNWTTIPNALKDVFGWMIDTGPDGCKVVDAGYADPNIGKPYWIEDYNGTGYGLFRNFTKKNNASSDTGPYTDTANLISPVYYWIGMHFDDAQFIEYGDKVFMGSVYHQSYAGGTSYGKRLGQQFLTALDGLEWREKFMEANKSSERK